MISDSHHHHQNARTAVPPPTTSTTQLAIHYRHLESLLDSALATLTLINATYCTPTPPFTLHTVQVTQALNHFIAGHPHTPTLTPTTDPTPHPDHGSTPMPMPAPATYATVADPHRSPSPTTPDPNTRKQSPLPKSRPPSPAPSVASARGRRIVIRFDLNPADRPVQSDLATLYNTVDKALQVDGKPMTYLGGVRWTQRGNLVLFPSTVCTALYLQQRRRDIWMAIRPLLGLPGKYKCPPFERDDAWHSVVIHGVPMPPDGEPESYDIETMAAFLDYAGEFVGAVKAFSILCRPEDLKSRRSFAMRVALSAETDAQWLIENGACFYGARCEVTPYIGRPRGVTPSSNI
ncbi:hypothetical protein B0H14DRAFT_2678901 [Mycena olivaceomarginata]|nr:hypothetical protein B0H14DRAFT_2678901 [Mycena olivaceomarginata]